VIAFTEKALSRIKLDVGEQVRILRDPKNKSLLLRVMRNRKTWCSRINGSDKSIGHFPALSIEDARRIHLKRCLESTGSVIPILTLGQYITEYDIPKSDSKTGSAKAKNLENAFKKSGAKFWDMRLL